jgi:hypothetical protein
MRSKIVKLLKSEVFDSIRIGFKYVLLIGGGAYLFFLLANTFPILLYGIIKVFFSIAVVLIVSYMIGDVIKLTRKQ